MKERTMSLSYLQRLRTVVSQSGLQATWPAWLATYFIVSMLLDRLSGWNVSSVHALLAGTALAILMFRQQAKLIALFFLVLLVAIAWMSFRDVVEGAGWKASERSIKAAIMVLGMLACCRLPLRLWQMTLAAVIPCGIVIMTAYVGPEQLVRALLMPFDLAAAGGLATPMNRNGLALPLGLLTCWAVAAIFQLRPRWLWLLLASALTVVMIANGSRNAMAALIFAALLMLFWRFPRKILFVGFGMLIVAVSIHYFFPGYWLHDGTLFNQRDVIWAEVFRHLPEHLWIGAGSLYFKETIAPGLPTEVIIAHNAYLDFLLAFGVIGAFLLTAAGIVVAILLRAMPLNPQAIWLYGCFGFLAMFGLFDRGHLDALMLAAMLMIPSLLMAMGMATTALARSSVPPLQIEHSHGE